MPDIYNASSSTNLVSEEKPVNPEEKPPINDRELSSPTEEKPEMSCYTKDENKKNEENLDLPLKNGKIIQKISKKIPVGHSLASFAAYPKGIRFQTQEEKEEIILLLRRHLITNFLWILIAFLMFITPIVFTPFFHMLIPFKIPLNFEIVTLIIWYSLIASSIIINFFVWYYNVYIVTNQRIIDVDFYSLTYKKIASATLDNVQDITIRAGGILRVIFDFADIDIQTAGTVPNFTFEAVPHPDVIAREIHDLLDDYKMYINKDNYESK